MNDSKIFNIVLRRDFFPVTNTVFLALSRNASGNDMNLELEISGDINKGYNKVHVSVSLAAIYYSNKNRDFSEFPTCNLIKPIMTSGFEYDIYASLKDQMEIIQESDRHIASNIIQYVLKGEDWLDWNKIISGDAPIDGRDRRIPNKDFKRHSFERKSKDGISAVGKKK